MKAIVYTTRGGSTKRYAEMLGNKFGVPVFSLKEALKTFEKNSEIVYLGWVLAGNVKGLAKASEKFKILAIGAVGLDVENELKLNELKIKNKAGDEFFMLKGAFNRESLKGIYRVMINVMLNQMMKPNNLAKLSKEEQESLKAFEANADYVKKDQLDKMLNYLKNR